MGALSLDLKRIQETLLNRIQANAKSAAVISNSSIGNQIIMSVPFMNNFYIEMLPKE